MAIVTGLTIVLGAITNLVHDHRATRHPDAAGGAILQPSAAMEAGRVSA